MMLEREKKHCRRFWERKVRKIAELTVLERDCQKEEEILGS